ncbi:hypothetical protein Tco_0657911 [Tanacetum coccineum]
MCNKSDRNSAFFHKVIKGRISRNRVAEIWGTDNIRYVDDEVPIQFVKHFESFLGPQPNMECLNLDSKIFKNKIDLDVAGEMIREVSKDEIKEAMFSIDDNKALGPDGFTVKFFKKVWFIPLIPLTHFINFTLADEVTRESKKSKKEANLATWKWNNAIEIESSDDESIFHGDDDTLDDTFADVLSLPILIGRKETKFSCLAAIKFIV